MDAIKLIIFDIDGTIKDLYAEHNLALGLALKALAKNKFCVSVALAFNKLGMSIFKIGCLPTSLFMQNLLLLIMAVITHTNYYTLKQKYYEYYPAEPLFFDYVKEEISFYQKSSTVVLASTNHYTMNMKKYIGQTLCVDEPKKKIFKEIIKDYNVKPCEVLIIGDNFFDDYLPARLLGANVHLVNRYNVNAKRFLIKELFKL